MRKEFRSRDFMFRPANGIGSALEAAGARVPQKREPLMMVIKADGKREVLHVQG